MNILRCMALLIVVALTLSAAEPRERRIYMIGNSLTDNVNYEGLKKLAESRGYKHTWGRSMTPGAPIFWHWSHDPAFTQAPFGPYRKALKEYSWDAITFQPFSTYSAELEAQLKFIEFLQPRNAGAQLFIYAQWMTRDKGDFDVAWTKAAPQRGGPSAGTREYYERFVEDVRKACPDLKPPRLVPAGHAMYLLNQKIKAGLVPGLQDIREVYNDGIHLNNVGAYIAGCSFFATIYGESPIGLSAEPYQPQEGHRGMRITPELARIIQESVWETVATHPLSGVNTGEPVRIATPILTDGTQGKPYEVRLLPAYGRAPFKWLLAKGELPAGLVLSPAGVISGTPHAIGVSKLVMQVNDATRELALKIVADTKPEIVEHSVPAGQVGAFYRHKLAARGGNGTVTFRPAKKESLPPGLDLQIDGEVAGTPVRDGQFTFAVEAFDADLGTPDSVTAQLSIEVKPPAPDVVFARQVAPKSVMVDGKLDEPFWRLENKIGKVVEGQPNGVEGSFDVATDGDNLYVAIRVKDGKLAEDNKELWNGDSVEVYLDTLNSRETVYNFQHRRLVCGPSGKRTYVIGEKFGIKFATQKTEDGYTVELAAHNYGLGVRLQDRAIGFDAAINESTDGHTRSARLVWRGTKDNDTDPSQFGTVVLSAK